MNKSVALLLLPMLLASMRVRAEEPLRSPLMGTWEVDTSRLKMPPEARPRRVTVAFASAADGRLSTRVDVVGPDGASMYAEGVSPLDGTPSPVQGNLEADTAATTMPMPTVLILQLSRDHVPGSTRIYTVSPDGASMIETAANFGEDGRPATRVNYFKRVEPHMQTH